MAMTFANHPDDSKDGSVIGAVVCSSGEETRALWDILRWLETYNGLN